MQIRAAIRADSAAIAFLLSQLGYPTTEAAVTRKLQQLDPSNAQVLVAVDETGIVGFVALNFIPQLALAGDFCRISYFCVQETARGQGIGTALEARVCALARARGCDRIEVHCHARRELAHQFYSRQGYVESPKYFCKSV